MFKGSRENLASPDKGMAYKYAWLDIKAPYTSPQMNWDWKK